MNLFENLQMMKEANESNDDYLNTKIKDYENLISENPIFLLRTKNKGKLSSDIALNGAITGVNLRTTGIDFDLRKKDSLYKDFVFNTVILNDGDALSRYNARVLEIKESCKIISQAINFLKKGGELKQTLVNPINLKLPAGEYYSEIEAPRGLSALYIKSDGNSKPYRLKWRTGSYYAVNLLRKLLVGNYLNDAIAIAGSLDFILPEVDK